MFKRKTLFVVGAGASKEAGLPLGTELAETIGTKMDIRFDGGHYVGTGDRVLYELVTQQRTLGTREYQQAAWLIRDGIGLARSIDDFLDLHRNDERVQSYGKAAIVQTVLEAERKSRLFPKPNGRGALPAVNLGALADTWFVKFAQMLTRGVPKEDARQVFDQVAFVVFNYDRCLEHFLLNALQKAYGISSQEASEILSDLTIIHPYGVIGSLQKLPFGGTENRHPNYVELAEGIKTYTEQIADADMLVQIANEVERAECFVYLGFAYHSQNLAMLRPRKALSQRHVFGTARGMSEADTDTVITQLGHFFEGAQQPAKLREVIKLEKDLTCAGLFDDYSKSLSGGD